MSRVEDIITVIDLACQTEDRTNTEQLALLRIARWVDREANKNTAQNQWMWGPDAGTESAVRQRPMVCMEEQVEQTREVSPYPEDNQKPVHLPSRRHKRQPAGNIQQRFGEAEPVGSLRNRRTENTAPL